MEAYKILEQVEHVEKEKEEEFNQKGERKGALLQMQINVYMWWHLWYERLKRIPSMPQNKMLCLC